MIIWGAIWGAILGYMVGGGREEEVGLALGALLGSLAGLTLRGAVRNEIRKQRAALLPISVGTLGVATPQAATEPAIARPTEVPPVAPELSMAQLADEEWETAHGPRQPREPAAPNPLVALARNWLFGGNTIVRMGVLVLFVGLAFLAKYAVDNALLPPELRLASIGLAGIALFVLGFRLRAKGADKLSYALTMQGAGVAVLYLTVFAAFRLYAFLPSGAAFVLLGVICAFSTAIALMQNSVVMAFIGFAGAFAAPLLVSTGQGSHVGLFGYYLLLNVAIASVAWLRAWRPLNLLGFFATFGVATAWGVLKYQPEKFASTEPFLIAFFLIYVVASLLYATRHSLEAKKAVDATLIFGTPLVAFGLQAGLVQHIEYATAFSALIMGGFYLGLGWWALKRAQKPGDADAEGAQQVGRWLAECFVALGLGFVTLAVPLALDARWTSAVWAAEGAAVYWMGQRQGRWLARATGLGLQAFAAVSYLSALDHQEAAVWPFANPSFIGAALLAGSALALAHWSRRASSAALAGAPLVSHFTGLEQKLSPGLFWVGFLWSQFAMGVEIERLELTALQANLHMLAWLGSAFVAHRFALPQSAQPWAVAATPAWFSLPVMLVVALGGMSQQSHVFESGGWLVWPVALVMHGAMLRALDAGAPQRWWSWVHSGGVWLLVLLVGNLLVWAVQQAALTHTSWAVVILLVSAIGVLLALSRQAWFDTSSSVRARWPLDRFASAYLWRAALPVALVVTLGCLFVAVHSNGNARPLPYVPLLNPTDLSVALGLGACALWLTRLRQSGLALPAVALQGRANTRVVMALVAVAFVAVNTVWLRVAHQFAAVPWNAQSLYDSFLVQAGYSILWTMLALGLMVLAHKRQARPVWMGGAGLLGATVLKLLLVDLSNRGGSERIVVFIAVGVLMLVVGYFAPMPPATQNNKSQGPNEVLI